MANDTDNPGGPMVIDTGGSGATGTITAALCKVKKIRLVPAAAASLATVTDTAGNVQAQLQAAANGIADEIDFGPNGKWITGIKVPTLSGTSAKLYIYCG
jgi:hypothetical protein